MENNQKVILILLITIILMAALPVLENYFQKDKNSAVIKGHGTGLGIGDLPPDFILNSLNGEKVQLSSFRGNKAVILNFWASWCPPCRQEMPAFEKIYRENKGNLEIIGINLQESPEAVRKSIGEIQVSYPILLDPDKSAREAYNVFTQPVTYFIGVDGRIKGKKFGPLTDEEIGEKLGKLLEDNRDKGIGLSVADEIKTLQDGTRYIIHPDELLSGGVPKDGIPSIDNPKFIEVENAGKWLPDDELGLGIVYRGEKRFYPFRILVSHEIVNDNILGDPILVSYCPLCFTGLAFHREIGGEAVEFGVSGKLLNSELVMYDRKTDSYWPQTLGKAVIGPLTGTKLKKLPTDTVKWGDWKKAYPDSEVLSKDTGFPSRDYSGSNPYGRDGDFTDINLRFRLQNEDFRLDAYEIVYGIELNGKFKAYKKSDLERVGTVEDSLGGEKIIVDFNNTLKSAKAKASEGSDIAVETLFWFAWAAFHPETEVYFP